MSEAERNRTLNEVKMYQSNGWDIKEETPEYFLLKRNTGTIGIHIVIFIFTWWTLGLCNLAYWALSNQTKKIIK
jgi:hypothetical protein